MSKLVIEYRFGGEGDWEEVETNRDGHFQHRTYALPVRDYEFRIVEKEMFAIGQVLKRKDPGRSDGYVRTVVGTMKDSKTPDGEQYTSYLVIVRDPSDGERIYKVHSEEFLLEKYISN